MRTIGRYEIEAEIGRGGMGAVFKGRDPALGRPVAIKLLLGYTNAKARRRFQTEVQTLGKIRHPNVVGVHASGEHDGVPYLVMDWVDGCSLEERLIREGPLDAREAAELCLTLAEALAEIHTEGVLHRDLKPSNVLLAKDGTPLLTDFGLAKDLGAQLSGSMASMHGAFLGTPGFLPPEQAKGELHKVGPRSDVYGLGATLFCTLTGEAPYTGENPLEVLAAMEGAPPQLPSGIRPVDKRLEQICMRCLAHEPVHRYPDALALADDLEAYLFARPARRAPAAAVAAALVLAAGGAAAFVVAGGAPEPAPPTPAEASGAAVEDGSDDVAVAARRLLAGGDHARAAAILSAALADHPEDPTLYLLRSQARRAAGDGEGAEADASSSISLDGERAEAWLARAQTRADREDWPGALTDASRALELEASAARHMARARIRVDAGDLEGGITDATAALALDAEATEAYAMRGQLWWALDDPEHAAPDLERALRLDPNHADALRVLAQLRLESGRAAEALPLLERATRLADTRAGDWHNLGLVHAALERTDLALQAFLQARELDPSLPHPWLQRGTLFNALGRFDEAAEELREAAKLAPTSYAVLFQLGLALTALEQWEPAAKAFQQALRVSEDPDELDALFNLAICAHRLGDLEPSERLFTQYLERRPDDVDALSARSRVRRELDRHDAALADLKAVVARAPTPFNLEARYRYLAELNHPAETLAALEAWIAAIEPTPDLLYALMSLQLEQGQVAAAIESARRFGADSPETMARIAGDSDPNSAVFWSGMAGAVLRDGNTQDALLYLSHAIALDDQRWEAWHDRGSLRLYLRDPAGALDDLERAAALAPDEAEIHYQRYRVLSRQNQLILARESLARALEADPDHARARFAQAESISDEDPQRAITLYQQLLSLHPDDPAALNNLAILLVEQGRHEEAITTATALLEQEPGALGPLLTRARAYKGIGDDEAALGDYARAQAAHPEAWEGFAGGGQLLRSLGRVADAEPVLSRAIELNPMPALYAQRSDARLRLGDLAGTVEDYQAYLAHRPDDHHYRLKLAQTLERMQRYRDALTVYEELAEVGDETRALEAMGRIAALREKLRE